MILQRGEIYLAYLNPKRGNEVGKLRPVLIYQSDMLNSIRHYTTTIIPLSSDLIDDAYPLRYRVSKRDNLHKESDLLCDQLRTIDNSRIQGEKIAFLSTKEMFEVDKMVKIVLGIEI